MLTESYGVLKRTIGAVAAIAMSVSVANAADHVTLALDWIVNGTHSGYFVAQAKGFYRDAGLDVTISRGFGSGDTTKRVGTGASMFGVADASTVIAAQANENVPVRIIAVVYGKAPLGIIYLAESKIKAPADIMGKKIARTASGSSVVMFPAFLQANNIDRSKIQESIGDANTLLPMLMSRRVDGVLGQTVHVERYKKIAEGQKLTVKTMNYSDYGLDAYGNSLIAGADVIKNNPKIVSRFVEASMKGIAYALAHPKEAVEIVKKAHPETDAVVLADEISEVTPVINTAEAQQKGLGFASEGRMKKTIDIVTAALKLKRHLTVAEAYDARFQPEKAILLKK